MKTSFVQKHRAASQYMEECEEGAGAASGEELEDKQRQLALKESTKADKT